MTRKFYYTMDGSSLGLGLRSGTPVSSWSGSVPDVGGAGGFEVWGEAVDISDGRPVQPYGSGKIFARHLAQSPLSPGCVKSVWPSTWIRPIRPRRAPDHDGPATR
jgi:hypothetical protein